MRVQKEGTIPCPSHSATAGEEEVCTLPFPILDPLRNGSVSTGRVLGVPSHSSQLPWHHPLNSAMAHSRMERGCWGFQWLPPISGQPCAPTAQPQGFPLPSERRAKLASMCLSGKINFLIKTNFFFFGGALMSGSGVIISSSGETAL